MDTKSLARSKRAHTQHHSRKSHQTSKSKSSSSIENAKNQGGKQVRSKQFHGSSSSTMPSNWDRYEEAMEGPGLGGEAAESRERASEALAPKSKGADFRYLISEAESQLQSRSGDSSEGFGSFDDDPPGFDLGIGSILSVRGNGIMSLVEDDDFVVDDKSSMGYQASFFSLDLHALASQLEKIDLSKRLFIEPKFLPPELYSEESIEEGTCTTVEAERNIHDNNEIVSAENASGYSTFPYEGIQVSGQGTYTAIKSKSICISPDDEGKLTHLAGDESKYLDQTNLGELAHFIADSVQTSVSEPNEKPSSFKAFDAEAELDMLLDSFGQTNLLDSCGTSKMPNESIPTKWNDSRSVFDGASSLHETQPLLKNGVSSSRNIPAAVNLEDKVDNLLAELSNLKHQGDTPLYANGKSKGQSSNLFESVDVHFDLDSTVDDLLAEASDLQEKKSSVVPLQHDAKLTNFTKPSPQSKTKLMNDFNSWLDTI